MNTNQTSTRKAWDEMKIIREVSNQAEYFYADAVKLGDHAALTLKASHRSQMTSLETIAESTLKTTDVFDYVKKQTARFPYWRQPAEDANEGFGVRLKKYLEGSLAERRDIICDQRLNIGKQTEDEQQERRRIHLLLMRQFIRQMVTQYEYAVSIDSSGNKRRES
jgi:hypothetical protein